MASIRIEPPRRHWMGYYTDRHGKLQHKSLGILHSPTAATPEEAKIQKEINRKIALATVNDLELAENGRSTPMFIRALFNAAMMRCMGVIDQNGARGMTVKGYLNAWLKLQEKYLHEGLKVYKSMVNTFCITVPDEGLLALFLLERRHIQEFIDAQIERGRAHSTINNKLRMLEKAFDDAVKRGHMLTNIIYDEDYLAEKRLLRKPLTTKLLVMLHERWTHLGGQPGEKGQRALEWRKASKFGAYQAMRLGDAVNQVRRNVDYGGADAKGFITWTPEKTEHLDRIVSLPLHSEVRKELLPFENAPAETKFTPLLSQTSRQDLCTEFKRELIATGIDPEDHKLKTRVYAAVSFHSHKRWSLNTMEKAFVPREILKLIGLHSSDESNSKYLSPWTKQEAEAWRPSIEKLRIELPCDSLN